MINLNHITAELGFAHSVIRKLDIETHRQHITESTKKEFSMLIKHSQPQIIGNNKVGTLLMQISVIVKSEDSSPDDSFTIVLEGSFLADKDLDEELFLNLLNLNGGAALYSIARSKLETISSVTYEEGKILLPMINMLQFFQQAASVANQPNHQDILH